MKNVGHKFIFSLAFIFCLVYGVLFFSQHASASAGEHFSWYDSSWGYDSPNFQGTISAGSNQTLFCYWRQSRNGDTVSTLYWNGDALTNYKVISFDSGKLYAGYLNNPDVGAFNITQSGQYVSAVMCSVQENIVQEQPVAAVSDLLGGVTSPYTYTFASSTQHIILNYAGYNVYGISDNSFTDFLLYDQGSSVGQGTTQYNADWYGYSTTGSKVIQPLESNKHFFITELNVIEQGGGGIDFEIIDAETVEGLYFRFNQGVNNCRVNMSCNIPFNFDTEIFGQNATGKVYYYSTATSSPSYLGEINLNTQRLLGIYGQGNLVATSSTASTEFSYYSVVPYSDIWSQQYATTTTAIWFLSEADFTEQYDNIWNTEHSIITELGIDTYKLACTDEQWASTSSIPFLGVSVDQLMCNTRKWVLDVGIKPIQTIADKLSYLRTSLMSIFPFNLIYKFQNSFQEAQHEILGMLATPAMAADISSSTGAYVGNFSFEAADLFGDGNGTTTITLLSKENMENLLGVEGFSLFNLICRILIWTAFAAYCWWVATARIHGEQEI